VIRLQTDGVKLDDAARSVSPEGAIGSSQTIDFDGKSYPGAALM
jgi:hypothetical protein